MRITFVISSISSGGAARVLSIMANYWASKQWDIIILTLDKDAQSSLYDISKHIRRIPLGVAGKSSNNIVALWNNLKRVVILGRTIRRTNPDIVISFLDRTNVITLLATRGITIPVIVSERTDPRMHSIGRVWQRLRWWSYPKAERIVVQTEEALSYFLPSLNNTCVIPNPIVLPLKNCAPYDRPLPRPSVIAMGRLNWEKGFDLLIRAFALLKDFHPEWTLTILGEGELRPELEALRDTLDLADRVYFPGQIKNPHKVLRQSDLFVLSSRYEGFPNVLLEAMACELPVISFACRSGPREIIRNGVDGILVPSENVEALAVVMKQLMSDEVERKRLASRAREVVERYSLEKVMGRWESLLSQVVKSEI